jgi:phage terminase large subunit-like protein
MNYEDQFKTVSVLSASLTIKEKQELVALLELREQYERNTLFYRWFNDIDGYTKHINFLNDGAHYRQRGFLAGNRVGKSQTGAYEATCHLTGLYPDWWQGKRFDKPTSGWIAGKTSATVKETVQVAMLGMLGEWGTGMLPKSEIIHVGKATSATVDYIQVKHISGGVSTVNFKTNDAGRQAFEGTAKDWIWIDEECDQDVYFECLMRTMTTGGIVYTTFTPLRGLTELVLSLLKNGDLETPADGVSITTCGWDDAPHLGEKEKAEMLAALPPWQRLSRTKGIPSLGSGVIYAVNPDDYTTAPFEIPAHWKRLVAMDVGWKRTAACWCAFNPEDKVMYIYNEHYKGEAEPLIHAEAIKAKGKNIPIVIDSAAHGRAQKDGDDLFTMYTDLGLDLHNANKAIETGLATTWSMLSFGKLKIFNNCTNLLSEMKTYRRDEKGNIIKSNDHLCDCMRYAVMTKDEAREVKAKEPIANAFYGYNPHTKTGL